MKSPKTTQKQLAFYKLYRAFKEDRERFVPTWEFGGEIQVSELNKWFLMSYKCPTRLSDIYQENPGLLERRQVRGKSGSLYYEYRIAPNPAPSKIIDPILRDFYHSIRPDIVVAEKLKHEEVINRMWNS